MKIPRFSIRSLLLCVTLCGVSIGALTWASRRFGDVMLIDTTPKVANAALRGFAQVPNDATAVSVRFTPFHVATLKFKLDDDTTRRWCRQNEWQIIDDSVGNGFEFATPCGGGRWFGGRVVYIVYGE